MGEHKYEFPESLDPRLVNEVAILYKWGGNITVNGQTIRSQRPMPVGLHDILVSYSKIESGPVYEDCRRVYHELLERGKAAFPEVDQLFGKYGYEANIILAQTLARAKSLNELRQHLGNETFEELLHLTLRRNVQPRLFD